MDIFRDNQYQTPVKKQDHGQILKKSKLSESGKRVAFHKAVSSSPLPHKASKPAKKQRHPLDVISNTPHHALVSTTKGVKHASSDAVVKQPRGKLPPRSKLSNQIPESRRLSGALKKTKSRSSDRHSLPASNRSRAHSDEIEYTFPTYDQLPEPGSHEQSALISHLPRVLAPRVPSTVERNASKRKPATEEDPLPEMNREPLSPFPCALSDYRAESAVADHLDRSFADDVELDDDDSDYAVEFAFPLPGCAPPTAAVDDEDDPLADESLVYIASTLLAPPVGCVTPRKAREARNFDSDHEELLDLSYNNNLGLTDWRVTESPGSSIAVSDVDIDDFELM